MMLIARQINSISIDQVTSCDRAFSTENGTVSIQANLIDQCYVGVSINPIDVTIGTSITANINTMNSDIRIAHVFVVDGSYSNETSINPGLEQKYKLNIRQARLLIMSQDYMYFSILTILCLVS